MSKKQDILDLLDQGKTNEEILALVDVKAPYIKGVRTGWEKTKLTEPDPVEPEQDTKDDTNDEPSDNSVEPLTDDDDDTVDTGTGEGTADVQDDETPVVEDPKEDTQFLEFVAKYNEVRKYSLEHSLSATIRYTNCIEYSIKVFKETGKFDVPYHPTIILYYGSFRPYPSKYNIFSGVAELHDLYIKLYER